jgi:flagellar FliL protein
MKKLFKNKKLLIVLVVVLLGGGGGAYKFVLAPKPAAAAPPKVDGELFALSPEFVVNLAGGHYGKVSVALLLSEPPAAIAPEGEAPILPQDPAIRAAITDELTGLQPNALIARPQRRAVVASLLAALKRTTDTPVKDVLLTDIAVQ